MDSIYLLLLHCSENGCYSIRIFTEAVTAHTTANWYNIYTAIHAEVYHVPITESITIDSSKRSITFRYKSKKKRDEVDYA